MDDKPSRRTPQAATLAPLFGLPAILAASSVSGRHANFGEPATWWGILVGATLALGAAGVGYVVTRRR